MKFMRLLAVILTVTFLATSIFVQGQIVLANENVTGSNNYVVGQVIVVLEEGYEYASDEHTLSKNEIESLGFESIGVEGAQKLAITKKPKNANYEYEAPKNKLLLLSLKDKSKNGVPKAIKKLNKLYSVVRAVPDYIVKGATTIPNDPGFANQYGMSKISATQAWDNYTGSPTTVVAVIDTGIDYNHPDLKDNIWQNPGEVPGNNADDDGNGLADDVYGWDFYNNDNDPMDDHGHGTHCAGVIGAAGNNGKGIAGVNWNTKLFAIKCLSSANGGKLSTILNAINYANAMGIKVSNVSWTIPNYSQELRDYMAVGGLFVAAAGNESVDIDSIPVYPAGYDLDNIISVAASDINDELGYFSNCGVNSVDIAAPGVDIYSCVPTQMHAEGYINMNGTSMAAPHVTGAAGLLLSVNPTLNIKQLREAILSSADVIPGLQTRISNGARLNVHKAVNSIHGSWAQKKASTFPAMNSASVVYNNEIYVLGGKRISMDVMGNDKEEITNTVDIYIPATNTWRLGSSMSNSRQGLGAVVLNDKIYALGGSISGQNGLGETYLSSVEEYNTSQFNWTPKASMNTARSEFGIAAVNRKIYAIGGKSNYNAISSVEEYNPDTDTWTFKTSMPTPRRGFGTAVVNNKIYVIGGMDSSFNKVNTVEEYDPATDTWTTKASMPTSRWSLTCSVVNGKIYAIGGSEKGNAPCTAKVEEYDPVTDTWNIQTSMLTGRNYLSSATVNNRIYAIGGNAKQGSDILISNIVEEFTPQSNLGVWVSKTDATYPRTACVSVTNNDKIYTIGGSYNENATKTVQEYDHLSDTWSSKASILYARKSLGAAVLNNKIYAVGGFNTETVEEFDPTANNGNGSWTYKASMSVPRYGLGVAAVNGKLYAIGGRNYGQTLGTVEEYDPVNGSSWITKTATMNTPRSYFGVAVVGGKIYVFGGLDANLNIIDTVEEYDPDSDTWTTKASMPTARRYLTCSVVNGKVYAMGGEGLGNSGNRLPCLNIVEEYDPSTNTWNSKAPMTKGRNHSSSAVVNNKLYVIGGEHQGSELSSVEQFTPDLGNWNIKASAPYGRSSNVTVEVNNIIYTVGGDNGGSTATDNLQKYDPVTNTWTLKARLGAPRRRMGGAALNGKIYVLGGAANGAYSSSTQEYDPGTDTWTYKASMPYVRHGLGAAAVNGKLYAIGGMTSAGTIVNSVFEYDPTTDTWTTKTSMPTARADFGISVVNNKIYVIGGKDSSNNRLNTVEEYDPSTDSWITKLNMPTSRWGLTCSVANGRIYAIGGNVNSDTPCSNKVEEYDPATNTWVKKAFMITGREYLSSAAVNDKIFTVGGVAQNGSTYTCDVVEEFTP